MWFDIAIDGKVIVFSIVGMSTINHICRPQKAIGGDRIRRF